MSLDIVRDSIDLGIVVRDADRALAFYRDCLGLRDEGTMPMPGGGTMHRLRCGESLIKLVALPEAPAESAAPGGIVGASGYRYWTITVSNLRDAVEAVEKAGYSVAVTPREIRPGIEISMLVDPDGNWVELLQAE